MTVIEYERAALSAQAADVIELARVEGLFAHGRSVEVRLEESEP
jgi:histidinol dehydrogenase